MKYLKIKIKRGDPRKGENQMMYPACYDAMEVELVKIGPILYPDEIGRGATEEDCVICFGDNKIAAEYVRDGGSDIVELTEAAVDSYMSTRWERRKDAEEQVTDEPRILSILTKKTLNMPLSTEDLDAINPDKRTPGVNRANKDHNRFFHHFKVDNNAK
jgi:hypothetical protein